MYEKAMVVMVFRVKMIILDFCLFNYKFNAVNLSLQLILTFFTKLYLHDFHYVFGLTVESFITSYSIYTTYF